MTCGKGMFLYHSDNIGLEINKPLRVKNETSQAYIPLFRFVEAAAPIF